MVIERGASNTLAVMARETLSPSYWLLHFNDPERNGNAYCVVQAGNATGAMVTLTFDEVASGAVAADGEVTLSPAGNWTVTVYEQTSPTNIDTDLANRMVREMAVFVEQGAAADSGWTEQCPDQYPGCDEVTVRINTVDVPVDLQNCEIDIDCTDVGNAAYVVVQGGASHSHGGLFIPTGVDVNGKPSYEKVDDPTRVIQYDDIQWTVEHIGDHIHYAAPGDEDFPWLADWSTDPDVEVVQAQISQLCNGIATPTKGTFVVGVPNQRTANSYINPPQRLGFVGHDEWSAISIGATHMVGIRNGRLYVAGDATNGGTGNGSGVSAYTPLTRIGNQSDWTHCAAGNQCSYAIRAGRLYVTGLNTNGQLGNGTTTSLTTFTQVGSDTNWQSVHASHSPWALAIKGDQAYTCGSNLLYQTGLNTNSGNTTSWTQIDNGPFFDASAGNTHGLFVKTDGTLYSWGQNTNGRTGQGTSSGSTQVPTQVGIDTDWSKCAAGGSHSLCVKQDGTMWGFGSNSGGKLGVGYASATETTPIQSGSSQGWTAISLSPSTNTTATLASYAMHDGVSIWGCGSDSYGEIMQAGADTNADWVQIGTAENHTLIAAGPGCLITVRT